MVCADYPQNEIIIFIILLQSSPFRERYVTVPPHTLICWLIIFKGRLYLGKEVRVIKQALDT